MVSCNCWEVPPGGAPGGATCGSTVIVMLAHKAQCSRIDGNIGNERIRVDYRKDRRPQFDGVVGNARFNVSRHR